MQAKVLTDADTFRNRIYEIFAFEFVIACYDKIKGDCYCNTQTYLRELLHNEKRKHTIF